MSDSKKVLILCPYSFPSACGIWTRVFEDAKALKSQGFDVSVFSSNIIKGTKNTSSEFEELEDIKIYRFPVLFSLGGTSMFWNFLPKIKVVNPDIVHSHGYRHPHSLFSLIWGRLHKRMNILTTHAPFEKDSRRSFFLKIIDVLYDYMFGWWELRTYKRVIRISNWETPYLEKLGLKNSILIANGIRDIFLNTPVDINDQKFNKVIFLGRIDPVKRLEWLVKSASQLKELNFKIVGPLSGYSEFKSELENLQVEIKTYSAEDFINEVGSSDIYTLLSAREAMPFTLLEAMSRGKIVISSNTNGGREVIVNGENGFIVNTEVELTEKIGYIYENWEKMHVIRYNAVAKAKEYTSRDSDQKLIQLYKNL